MKENNISLRKLRDDDVDYKLLEKWYQEEEIYLNFEQRKLSYKEVKEKYLPRTKEDAKVPVFMIEYNNELIGIIQYQLISDDNKKIYNLNINNSYEIDIFIGELRYHNKGIGRRCIELLTNYLFQDKNANVIVMCPLKKNENAIRCYQNCGFKIEKEFITEDTIGKMQKYILMVKKK